MQAEPALDIVKIQEALLGIPRSVGDFFTWGPVITDKASTCISLLHVTNYTIYIFVFECTCFAVLLLVSIVISTVT
jgi:hypothetical protein